MGSALGSGQAHTMQPRARGEGSYNPAQRCEPSLGSAMPLVQGEAHSQRFCLV